MDDYDGPCPPLSAGQTVADPLAARSSRENVCLCCCCFSACQSPVNNSPSEVVKLFDDRGETVENNLQTATGI